MDAFGAYGPNLNFLLIINTPFRLTIICFYLWNFLRFSESFPRSRCGIFLAQYSPWDCQAASQLPLRRLKKNRQKILLILLSTTQRWR